MTLCLLTSSCLFLWSWRYKRRVAPKRLLTFSALLSDITHNIQFWIIAFVWNSLLVNQELPKLVTRSTSLILTDLCRDETCDRFLQKFHVHTCWRHKRNYLYARRHKVILGRQHILNTWLPTRERTWVWNCKCVYLPRRKFEYRFGIHYRAHVYSIQRSERQTY
jgi:hypothetical protein